MDWQATSTFFHNYSVQRVVVLASLFVCVATLVVVASVMMADSAEGGQDREMLRNRWSWDKMGLVGEAKGYVAIIFHSWPWITPPTIFRTPESLKVAKTAVYHKLVHKKPDSKKVCLTFSS